MRYFADPIEGLVVQLEELRGFARTVPPLIESDRQARWDQIANSPGDPDEDIVEVYANASGKGTGAGFADFGRTVFAASIVLGWQVFLDYLAIELAYREGGKPFYERRTVRNKLEEEIGQLSFPKLCSRYRQMGLLLKSGPHWNSIREVQQTRNALVHNHGLYTRSYFRFVDCPRYPVDDPLLGRPLHSDSSHDHDWLIDMQQIPLDFGYVSSALERLTEVATEVNDFPKS